MIKWINVQFESSCYKTKQFNNFANAFKREVKKMFPNAKLTFNVGHFYISGFIEQNEKTYYISTSDVRYFRNEWFNKVLVRTAKNTKDYSGGMNNYCKLTDLPKIVAMI